MINAETPVEKKINPYAQGKKSPELLESNNRETNIRPYDLPSLELELRCVALSPFTQCLMIHGCC